MLRILSLLGAYFAQYMKARMSYRANFFLQTGSLLAWAIVNLALINVLFLQVPTIQGWTHGEVLLIYGVAQTSFALSFVVFANLLWLASKYIMKGELDRLLLRPLDPLVQLLMEQFSAEDSLLAVMGFAVILWALNALAMPLTPLTLLLVVLVPLTGAMVYGGLMVLVSSLSFWLKDRSGLLGPILESSDQVSRYPLTIYPGWLRVLLSTLLPLGFVAFYPAQAFMPDAGFLWAAWLSPMMGIGMLGAGYGLFRLGLRTYESAGS